jgi:hypothetical protein
MTPGTAKTRNKSVTFGATVLDNEGKNGIGKSGIPNNCPGKFPSPWTPRVDDGFDEALEGTPSQKRRTPLTKTLEESRERKPRKSSSMKTRDLPKSLKELEDTTCEVNTIGAFDVNVDRGRTRTRSDGSGKGRKPAAGAARRYRAASVDTTIDINDPKSESGRYWKGCFEQYEEKVEELRIVSGEAIRLKDLSKLYAKTKDAEAAQLARKLKEEQDKVFLMENEVSKLVAQVAADRRNGKDIDPAALMKQLARRTADAVHQKHKIGKMETAFDSATDYTQGPREFREQMKDVDTLRTELREAQFSLSTAEIKIARLQEENEKLSHDLERSERRRIVAEEHVQRKSEIYQRLQEDYEKIKEGAKTQRREAQNKLQRRHDEVADLKREVASLKASKHASSSEKPTTSEERTAKNDKMVEDYKRQLAESKITPAEDPDAEPVDQRKRRRRSSSPRKVFGLGSRSANGHEPAQAIDLAIIDSRPAPEEALYKRSPVRPKTSIHVSTTPKSSYKRTTEPALSTIINDAKQPRDPLGTYKFSFSPSKDAGQLKTLPLGGAGYALPPTEPSISYPRPRSLYDNDSADARPASLAIHTSPTRAGYTRPRDMQHDNADRQRPALMPVTNDVPGRETSFANSQSRTSLPPERFAAAMASIEQRRSKKKRSQGQEHKENIRL